MYIAIIVLFSKYIYFKLASISVFLKDLFSIYKKQICSDLSRYFAF